jgi:small subunit ribosomal protein S8
MDPIADFLTSIRNGYLAKKATVSSPLSKIKVEIAKILVENGFLTSYEVIKEHPAKIIATLHYMNEQPVLTHLKKISVPGVRRYSKSKELIPTRIGVGISIISTSKGLMTDKKARKEKLGGEVICRLW